MKLTVTTMLLGGTAALLIWAGVTDRNPVAVLRAMLTGKELPEAGSWGGGSGGVTRSGRVVGDPAAASSGGNLSGNGKTPA